MTKEDVKTFEINARNTLEKQGAIGFHLFIENFFDSNVCIPKGQQRHKYADVLHEWIEGAEIQKIDLGKQWWGVKDVTTVMSQLGIKDGKYRIKPSEPVYENYYYISDNSGIAGVNWFTDDEATAYKGRPIHKAIGTERIRQ